MDRKEAVLKKFGKHLMTLREERTLTIEELAARCGLTPAVLRRIEAGKVNILFSTVLALARGLKVTPDELLKPLDPD